MIFQKALLKSFAANSSRVAIENNGATLTYDQLFQRSNAITHFLLSQNLSKGTYVGVKTRDREAIITAMIGIMNAGCVFVPINPDLPPKREETILKELNLHYLVTSGQPTGASFDFDTTIQGTDTPLHESDYPHFDEEDSIYVYFTSGSTGIPKGIIGRNKSLLQYLQWQIGEFAIDENCIVSQFISPYFDAFLRDVFVPLLSGGRVCLTPAEEDFFTPSKLASWMKEMNITHVHCVPSVFRIINEAAVSGNMFPQLKYIKLSGEKINPAELVRWYELFGNRIQLVNFYGATETTMIRSFYRIQPQDARKPKIPIGTPISDTQLLVLNKNGKICAAYVPGDLYIATPYSTKGYINDELLTKEKFVQLFAGTAQECMAFKTGDKARIIEEGKIDLLGRDDRQVKIRGIRVEPGEIENIMLQTGLLKNVLVVKQSEVAGEGSDTKDDQGDTLQGFVIRAQQADAGWEAKLRTAIKDYLPDYMIPAMLTEMESFPLLPNGKIDYKELFQKSMVKRVIKPVNETEEKLLQAWKGILGNKEISTEDSFQEAGGNSLSIMRLIAKIYKEYNVRISLNDLFNNLTIKKQAALIQEIQKDESLHIKAATLKDAYQASSAQERMYYEYQFNKKRTAFNMPMAWEIGKDVDLVKLLAAFRALVARHESLRTHFILRDNQILQVINENAELEIAQMEMPAEGIEKLIKPFNLSKAPLMRCAILSKENGQKILFTDMHHIICDGMSQINLFSDLLHLYKGESLWPLLLQYKDYAEWEQQFKMKDEYISHRGFWLQSFEGELPKLQLPPYKDSMEGIKGNTQFFQVSYEALAPLMQQWKQDGITSFSGLLSVYFVFMAQWCGQNDIIVGINSTGRMQDELEDVVGMFAKTLPIRFQVSQAATFREFSKQVHQHLRLANTRQVYDYVDIVNELNSDCKKPLDSLFDTMMVFQNFEHRDTSAGEELLTDYNFRQDEAKYPLTMFINEEKKGFRFRMEYQLAYFTPDEMAALIRRFEQLIINIATDTSVPLGTYMIADTSEILETARK